MGLWQTRGGQVTKRKRGERSGIGDIRTGDRSRSGAVRFCCTHPGFVCQKQVCSLHGDDQAWIVTFPSPKRPELVKPARHRGPMEPKILGKPRVLIVDDDPEFAQLIEFNLTRQGCDILVAHEGLQALRVARTELPDVILLDVMLPDIEGFTVCEILRAHASTRDIPVFILSALHESWASR